MIWALLTLISLRNIFAARDKFKRARNEFDHEKLLRDMDPRMDDDSKDGPQIGLEAALVSMKRNAKNLIATKRMTDAYFERFAAPASNLISIPRRAINFNNCDDEEKGGRSGPGLVRASFARRGSSRRAGLPASTKEVDSDSDSTDSGDTSSDDSVTDSSDSSSSESSVEDNQRSPPRETHAAGSARMTDISAHLIKGPAVSELARRSSAPEGDSPSRRTARRRNSRKHGKLPKRKFGRVKKDRTKSGLLIISPDVPVGRPALRADTGTRALLASDSSEGIGIEEGDQPRKADRTLSELDVSDFNGDPSEGSAFKGEAEASTASETSSNLTRDESDGGLPAHHHTSSDSLYDPPMHEAVGVEDEPGDRNLPEEEINHPTLRFDVGQAVYCKVGPHPITDWKKGKVAKLWHHETSWPPDVVAPYKVKLGKKKYVFAPRDSDDVICLAPPVAFC